VQPIEARIDRHTPATAETDFDQAASASGSPRLFARGRNTVSVDASAIRTAVKRGTTAAGTGFARHCRRQVNTKLAETP
jgi:hypothetical protein